MTYEMIYNFLLANTDYAIYRYADMVDCYGDFEESQESTEQFLEALERLGAEFVNADRQYDYYEVNDLIIRVSTP